MHRLSGTLETFIKIELASNFVPFWTLVGSISNDDSNGKENVT